MHNFMLGGSLFLLTVIQILIFNHLNLDKINNLLKIHDPNIFTVLFHNEEVHLKMV